jgi:hypothetical protein
LPEAVSETNDRPGGKAKLASFHAKADMMFKDSMTPDLDLRWKLGPVWLTGFTTSASRFCLHLLARGRARHLRFCRTMPNMKVLPPSARASAKEIAIA